jgi:hypothetical protein
LLALWWHKAASEAADKGFRLDGERLAQSVLPEGDGLSLLLLFDGIDELGGSQPRAQVLALARQGLSMTAEGDEIGSAPVFVWNVDSIPACEWPVSGDSVPNQTVGPDGFGTIGVGQGGTAKVTLFTACRQIDPEYALADPCDGGGPPISVDLETNVDGLPGLLREGVPYRLSSSTTVLPPVDVVFVDPPCPVDPPTGDFGIATKCDPFEPLAPATVIYAVNPAVGLGNGSVRLIFTFPNPSCPTRVCTTIAQYQPTTTVSDGPATPGTAHLGGTACGLPTQTTCQSCPNEPVDPRPESRGDAMLDAMGFDPAEELRRVRAGGCCGQPGV